MTSSNLFFSSLIVLRTTVGRALVFICTTVGWVAVPSTILLPFGARPISVVRIASYWRSLSPISLIVIHLTNLVRCPLSWVNGAGLMLPLRPVPTHPRNELGLSALSLLPSCQNSGQKIG